MAETMNAEAGVVIAETTELNLRLFGAISNGNAVIPLGNNKALKLVRGQSFKIKGRDAYKVLIQIIEVGIGSEVKTQSWNKTKIITKKAPKKEEPKDLVEIKEDEPMKAKTDLWG